MQVPKYRLHKATGQAVATFNGRDIYLGKHGSKESEAYYSQLLAEFKERGAVRRARKVSVGRSIEDDYGHRPFSGSSYGSEFEHWFRG